MNDKHIFRNNTRTEALLEKPIENAPINLSLPSEEEKNESVRWILDTAMPQRNPVWGELCRTAGLVGLHTLFFGVGDSFFLAALVLCVCMIPAVWVLVEMECMASCLFLVSPAFYALAHLLTMWKEYQTRTLEWKRTWRTAYQMVMALRMLVFGAVSVVVSVLLCALLWALSGQIVSFLWLLSVSFSALFLYGGGSLLCQRIWGMCASAFVPVVWLLAGLLLVVWKPASIWLTQLPVFIFLFTAVVGGLFYFYEIGHFLRRGCCENYS